MSNRLTIWGIAGMIILGLFCCWSLDNRDDYVACQKLHSNAYCQEQLHK